MNLVDILAPILAYIIGSFPTGVVVTKRKYGIDVREMGSGNIGATNVTRAFGWYAGILTFAVDLGKGYVPLYILKHYFILSDWTIPIVGVVLVLGHCYSVFLKFNGGKGVATSLGCILFAEPLCAAISAGVYLLLLILSKVSAVGSLGGMVSALIYIAWVKPEVPIQIMIVTVSAIVLWRHKQNIRRLIQTVKERKSS